MSDQFAKWKAMRRGEQVAMHENEPIPGYYRTRMGKDGPWVPVALWYQDWPKNEDLLVLRAGKEVALEKVWPYCVSHHIDYSVYLEVAEHGADWPDQHPAVAAMGHNQGPESDTFENIKDQIENLTREADKLLKTGAAKTQAEADQASHLANKLGELQKKADELRAAEKKPHDEAAKAVQNKWKPIVDAAEIYKRVKAMVVGPFLTKLAAEIRAKEEAERKAAEAAVAKGEEPPPQDPVRQQVKAGSGGRRSVALRTVRDVTIEDHAKVLGFFADDERMKNFLQDLAEKAVRAGATVPGVKIIERQIAA